MFSTHNTELLVPNSRVHYFVTYENPKESTGSPPFLSVYVCHDMLPDRIVYVSVDKEGYK